jgi:hypothetical protein
MRGGSQRNEPALTAALARSRKINCFAHGAGARLQIRHAFYRTVAVLE